jgi:hypothetical protein
MGVGMIPELAIEEALLHVDSSPHDDRLLQGLLRFQGDKDVNALVQRRSQLLASKVSLVARTLDSNSKVPAWLNQYNIIWTPKQKFSLSAVQMGNRGYIVVSNGFLDALNLLTLYHIALIARREALEPDGAQSETADQSITDFDRVFLRLYDNLTSGRTPIFLPELVDEMPPRRQVEFLSVVSSIRLFSFLHEVGHFELGHMKRGWFSKFFPKRAYWRNESPIKERWFSSMELEHEADVFAIRNGPPSLISAAAIFFLALGILHSRGSYSSETHPHAANRLARLYDVAGSKADLTGFGTILELSKLMGPTSSPLPNVSLERKKRDAPNAPPELWELWWFLEQTKAILSEA